MHPLPKKRKRLFTGLENNTLNYLKFASKTFTEFSSFHKIPRHSRTDQMTEKVIEIKLSHNLQHNTHIYYFYSFRKSRHMK